MDERKPRIFSLRTRGLRADTGTHELSNTKEWYPFHRDVTSHGFYAGISDSKILIITIV
jgi:hypothetical protein